MLDSFLMAALTAHQTHVTAERVIREQLGSDTLQRKAPEVSARAKANRELHFGKFLAMTSV